MDRRSRFEYGASGSFETSLAARPWNPADETIGGTRTASSGLPASYIVRRDALVDLRLRIREAEWPDFLNLVTFGQGSGELTWFPDALEPASYLVYLEAPKAGDRWAPERVSDYPRVFEVSLTLRGVGIVIPWQDYFE